ncbi:MAG TPA: hypothetical protein VKR32_16235 [Puia sp.]|nr:hypothetical protein [Puia sp.]
MQQFIRSFAPIILVLMMAVFNAEAQTRDSSRTNPASADHIKDPFDIRNDAFGTSSSEAKSIVMGILKNPPAGYIYLIDGKQSTPDQIKKLDYSELTDAQILPAENAKKKFGLTGEKGLIGFWLKKKKAKSGN